MFNVGHLNVHSLMKKTDKLKVLIQSLHQKEIEVDAIQLYETFLHTEALKLVQVPNFSLYYNNSGKYCSGNPQLLDGLISGRLIL